MDQPSSQPRFSILIPVYNRPELVRLTVDSVLAQTFTDYEVIVIDDGSTDQTVEMLRAYGPRLKLLQQPNSGAEVARSKGAAIATGEYFVILDSDDLLYPTALANYDRVIRARQAPPVILGAMCHFRHGTAPPENRAGDDLIQLVQFPDFLAKDRQVGLSCSIIVVKRSVAEACGALRKNAAAFPFDGTDIMLLLGTCAPCVLLQRPFTVAYRVHDANVSGRLEYLLQYTACLARYERLGHYPGGAARWFDRYAYVGGVSWYYASRGLRRGLFKLSLALLLRAFPMVAIGAINTVRRRLRPPAPLITLPP